MVRLASADAERNPHAATLRHRANNSDWPTPRLTANSARGNLSALVSHSSPAAGPPASRARGSEGPLSVGSVSSAGGSLHATPRLVRNWRGRSRAHLAAHAAWKPLGAFWIREPPARARRLALSLRGEEATVGKKTAPGRTQRSIVMDLLPVQKTPTCRGRGRRPNKNRSAFRPPSTLRSEITLDRSQLELQSARALPASGSRAVRARPYVSREVAFRSQTWRSSSNIGLTWGTSRSR